VFAAQPPAWRMNPAGEAREGDNGGEQREVGVALGLSARGSAGRRACGASGVRSFALDVGAGGGVVRLPGGGRPGGRGLGELSAPRTVRDAQLGGPRDGCVGSGCHLHTSLWWELQNLMTGGPGPHGLSDEAQASVAGVLEGLPAL
jgi:hypothetical protein